MNNAKELDGQLREVLEGLLERDVTLSRNPNDEYLQLEVDGKWYRIQLKATGDISSVVSATNDSDDQLPVDHLLVVVPFMSAAAAEYCRNHHISWVDLSGNARIVTDELLIKSQGKPNRFRRKRTTPNPFAPKSTRLIRQLLTEPTRRHTQKELIELTQLPQGLVSRLVKSLKESGFLADTRIVNLVRPNALLAAWVEAHQFDSHEVLQGHVSARTGPELSAALSNGLRKLKIDHSATGLAGAWLWDKFANYRLATFYVERMPIGDELKQLGLRDTERGANVWLARPQDKTILESSKLVDNVPSQYPLQVYVDLQSHPERAKDAALELRRRHLDWGTE